MSKHSRKGPHSHSEGRASEIGLRKGRLIPRLEVRCTSWRRSSCRRKEDRVLKKIESPLERRTMDKVLITRGSNLDQLFQ